MPKVGMEPLRRDALIRAAIAEIGAAGSLDVTVGSIARRAGVSAALAHHYFGSKDQILLAGMQRILEDFGTAVRVRLRAAENPRDRLSAIVEACFETTQFDPSVVAAWLAFYVQAQQSPEARRLLTIYARRLHSNLVHELVTLVPRAAAGRIALGIGAMIDGFYIRTALAHGPLDGPAAAALVTGYLDLCLATEKTA
ncbi:transcriptional regulator BetI [Aurantimonas sp. Leaf443]|uniref:transcriptional regulator BetI n=1 Tax=Aurantimonas sp. Leaf443 TaxID=1736378 RepID=UPI0006FE9C4E|nr:transcriptional regulator BetI [Aurantimonas sp. Leaf443]KQT87493.1 transcriptional repressor BetI [Aurantimonas sp. Leaf443]